MLPGSPKVSIRRLSMFIGETFTVWLDSLEELYDFNLWSRSLQSDSYITMFKNVNFQFLWENRLSMYSAFAKEKVAQVTSRGKRGGGGLILYFKKLELKQGN